MLWEIYDPCLSGQTLQICDTDIQYTEYLGMKNHNVEITKQTMIQRMLFVRVGLLDGWALVDGDGEVSLGSRMGLGGVDLTGMGGGVERAIHTSFSVSGSGPATSQLMCIVPPLFA